jgi:hypothetical protein
MILENPGTSPSVIAHAHGFSAAEVAQLLPIFLDNLRADFASADGPALELAPPAPQPGETPEEHADRYLRALAHHEHLDVVGYDTIANPDPELHGAGLDGTSLDDSGLDDSGLDDTGLDDTGLDDTGLADTGLGHDPSFLDTPSETPPHEVVEFDEGVDHAHQPAEDLPDLEHDDPFAEHAAHGVDGEDTFHDGAIDGDVHPAFDADDPEHGVPVDADDPGGPFAVS